MKNYVTEFFDNSLFSDSQWQDKSVLIIVPHEDDELNLTGATICNLLQHKIKVRVVFCTNADRFDRGELRVREAMASCKALGMPRGNIIFLGYCNTLRINKDVHFYNGTTDDILVTSTRKLTETYCPPEKPEFCFLHHQIHHAYTKRNFRNDIKEVISLYKPDVIFVNDFDRHPDHRAVSFIFEEALAKILQTPGNTYHPEVYKGFAYNGAFLGKRDFYTYLNLGGEERASAEYSNNSAYDTDFPPYDWDKRLRLPVPGKFLSRTIKGSRLYPAIKAYLSQGLIHNAKRIINSDQVFWQRRTDSLSYQARFSVSSGNGTVLNDFKLADCADILQEPANLDAGTWIPDKSDPYKEVFIQFHRPQKITRIILHGNIDFNSRVLSGFLTFSNGKHLEFGSLRPGAKPTIVDFPLMENIVSIRLTLLNTQGPKAGLNEIEIYEHKVAPTLFSFIKLMVKDTFAYDYWVDNKVEALYMNIYAHDSTGSHLYEGRIPERYVFTYVGGKNFKVRGSTIYLQKGFKEGVVRVTDKEQPELFDQIVIHRKSYFALFRFKCVQAFDALSTRIEHLARTKYYKKVVKEKDPDLGKIPE
jgi:LmbE family N-acetylglucosaminyl deacetylase